MADSQEKKDEQKKKLWVFLRVAAVGIVVLLIYMYMANRPLDEILDYEVEVTPLPKGAVEITYRYQWKVLNDSREGPLEWVKLGMANYDYGIVEYGGAISDRRRYGSDVFSNDGPYACFDLNRAYYKGEVLSFWFTVTQSSLMCNNPEAPDQPFYDFTPGWFDHTNIKHYKFIWNNPATPISHNADKAVGDSLIWEGSLSPGKKRNMRVYYHISDFDSPHLVNWSQPYGNSSGESGINGSIVFLIIVCTGYFGYQLAWGKSTYSDGRGYGGGYSHYHHRGGGMGGGGCACACAGCACACACAGGGRAGCSQKDFYNSIHVPKEIPKI